MTFTKFNEKSREDAAEALAHHAAEEHLLPALDRMLYATAFMVESTCTFEELYNATMPLCAGCEKHVTRDNGIYYRHNGRTQLCCSLACHALAQSHTG